MWCEHCRDHFSTSHYDENDEHKVGPEFGPMGELLARDGVGVDVGMGIQQMVQQFHEAYGCPDRLRDGSGASLSVPEKELRYHLIKEEFHEFLEALWIEGDVVEVADALADLAYVVYGAAITFGIDLDACVREVHRSNMSKLGEDGKPLYREDGKVLKGPSYVEPNLRYVLFGDAT